MHRRCGQSPFHYSCHDSLYYAGGSHFIDPSLRIHSGQIFVMYNPAVRSTVDIIDTWVYRTGLEQLNISLSSAVGLFKSFVSMLLVVFVNALARRWGGAIW